MRYEPADLFFVAGEASGDLQASLLAEAVKRVRPALSAAALGGERLRRAGVPVYLETSELASIGPLSLLPKIPYLYLLLLSLDSALRAKPPGMCVPVDAGAFNLRLARRLRRGGFRRPILYYFPPGAWLDNADQARSIASLCTALTPFAHQRDFYRSLGLPIAFFGHPLVSVVPARSLSTPAGAPVVAVLPGSRREEAERHLPILARASRQIARLTGARFLAIAASEPRARQIERIWARGKGAPISISRRSVASSVASASVAWVASGTAVLETALVGVPQIVFYRLSKFQQHIALRRLPGSLLARKCISLPNLVLERQIVPELVADALTPLALAEQTLALMENEGQRRDQLDGYACLRDALGPPDALTRIAEFTIEQLDAPLPS